MRAARVLSEDFVTPVQTKPAPKVGLRPATRTTPFIKWVGGKSRLLPDLLPLLPTGVNRMRHVEPFVGGGALFFAREPKRALLCDINADLVGTYTMVRDDPQGLLRELTGLAALPNAAEAYYERRQAYNSPSLSPLQRAAHFVYLNKTCFNGLHRVNRQGGFNVPFGKYKNPKIVDASAVLRASEALQGATLEVGGFENLLRHAKPGDFVYFDPPYEPLTRTASFTGYAQEGFSQADQTRLRDVFQVLHKRGCKLMLSNSDVPFIRELYAAFDIRTVMAPRAVSANPDGRGPVAEVVVRNYK